MAANEQLTYKVRNLTASKRKLEKKCDSLSDKLSELKNELSDNVYYKLNNLARDIPANFFELYGKRMKFEEEKPDSVYKERVYSKTIQTFALTLHSYSPKSYEYIRECFR